MKLYFSKGACSLTVRINLHEMNIPSVFEAVNLKSKETETGVNFLTINPKGAVPTLVLDNNEILTENTAILQYLADIHNANHLLPPIGDFKRYRVLEWLSYISADIHKSCGPLFDTQVPEKDKKEIFVPNLKNKLTFAENHLKNNKYLLNDQFTLPDAYLFVILRWMPHLTVDLSEFPNLSRYFNELKQRPAIQQALTEEGLA